MREPRYTSENGFLHMVSIYWLKRNGVHLDCPKRIINMVSLETANHLFIFFCTDMFFNLPTMFVLVDVAPQRRRITSSLVVMCLGESGILFVIGLVSLVFFLAR